MRTLALLCLAAALVSAPLSAQSTKDEPTQAAIRQVLARQVDAWNARNLEGFMAGYWNSPDLTFYSGSNVTRGWQPTLERYRNKYQAAGKEMGKLDFFDLEVEVLAPDAAVVYGHWHLTMSHPDQNGGGLFTLVFRKFPDGWKIIHDHTS